MTGLATLFRYIGLRHLLDRPFRTSLTVLGVALGVSLYIAITVINRSTLNSFKENIDSVAGKATLIVSGGQTGFAEEYLEKIKKVPGVKHAVPMVESRAYFAGEGAPKSETLMIFGVDLLQEQAVRTYKTTDQKVVDDPLVFLNQPDSLIVSQSFADEFHLKIDSVIQMATAKGKQKFTVRGILTPEGPAKAYGGSVAIMDIDGARMTFGKEGRLDRVDIVVKTGESISAVEGRLKQALGSNFSVERPETQSENMERMVKSYQGMLSFFSTFALLVGIFLVSNSLNMAVAERRREIGSLRSLGATRSGILILFVCEALVIGLAGALIGAGLGRLLAGAMVDVVSKATEAQFLMKVQVTKIVFGWNDVLISVLIGIFASVLAAFLPALRAVRVQPLEAMRRVTQQSVQKSGLLLKVTPLIALAMIGFSSWVSMKNLMHVFPSADFLNQACAVIGAALFAPFLATTMIRLIKATVIKSGSTVSRLAQENLLRNPRRTGSNIMSLIVGLMLVVAIAIVGESFKRTIAEWYDRIFKMDLVVSSNGRMVSFQMQPVDESLGRELMQIPGVVPHPLGTAPAMRFIHLKYQEERIGIKAVDEPDPEVRYSMLDLIDRPREEAGRELFESKDPTVIVSQNFVKNFKKKTGDRLTLETPSGSVDFRVVGVLTDFASPVGTMYMKRDFYKKYWNDPLVSAFYLRALPSASAEEIRREVNRRFTISKNLVAASANEMRKDILEVIDQSFYFIYAIEFAALLVGLLGLLNTMTISVLERTREIGMLRAVGMSRRQLFGMIFQESIVQGIVGAISAVFLGTYMVYFWVKYSLTEVLGWMVDFHFPWQSILVTVLSGMFVACLAGWYPARRASRIVIREALDYE